MSNQLATIDKDIEERTARLIPNLCATIQNPIWRDYKLPNEDVKVLIRVKSIAREISEYDNTVTSQLLSEYVVGDISDEKLQILSIQANNFHKYVEIVNDVISKGYTHAISFCELAKTIGANINLLRETQELGE